MDKNNGSLYIVSTPIGNLDDITLRALEVLKKVDICAAEDTRTSKILLSKYNINTKLTSYHKFSEKSKTLSLIENLKSGMNVALISDAGTPLISDPGKYLLDAAILNKISVIPIPGATSVIPALTVSGFNLDSFCFYGFFPRQKKEQIRVLKEISVSNKTSVFFESGKRIDKMLDTLLSHLQANTNIIVAREITKIYETFYRGDIETVAKNIIDSEYGKKGEFVVVIEGNLPDVNSEISEEDKRILEILLEKLDKKLAFELASKILNKKRNDIYKIKIKS
tara:strand:- start:212 stop:1051 length:840 start_codon:yes stop_codon:yes gene_type:complete